jgi:hypothetical protein
VAAMIYQLFDCEPYFAKPRSGVCGSHERVAENLKATVWQKLVINPLDDRYTVRQLNCHFDHSQQPNYSSVTKMHQNKIYT